MKKTDDLIIIEETFNSSTESVWKAITDIGQMRKWYFSNLPDFKPDIGFKTEFNVKSDERNFLHKWKVLEVKTEQMIKYLWEFEEYPGKSTTKFELFNKKNQTKLKLTVDVLEDFPENIPEFKRDSCIAGWDYFINKNLKAYLENNNKEN